jgi:prophage antirepressor-like protein
MANLQIFNNPKFGQVRTIVIDGKTLFGSTDVAKALGYTNPHKAIIDHCKGVTKREVVVNSGLGEQKVEINFISEGDIYRLASKSELPGAEEFESWIFDEVLPSIRKTGGYVANDDLFIKTYLPFADESTKALFKSTLEVVKNQNQVIMKQQKELQHKEDVIIGLVDSVELAEKRQILNRVVRHNNANFQDRWRELYKQFEMKYHINLDIRLSAYNQEHKPKLSGKLDYIDKVMGKVSDLYEIACKLYENDIKELTEQMYKLSKPA